MANFGKRDIVELAKVIAEYTLETTHSKKPPTSKDLHALERHIKAKWGIGEILDFAPFTHGGVFSAPDGEWKIEYAGYRAKTPEGMKNLTDLFTRLVGEINQCLGAIAYARNLPTDTQAKLQHPQLVLCFTRQDFYNMTLGEVQGKLGI